MSNIYLYEWTQPINRDQPLSNTLTALGFDKDEQDSIKRTLDLKGHVTTPVRFEHDDTVFAGQLHLRSTRDYYRCRLDLPLDNKQIAERVWDHVTTHTPKGVLLSETPMAPDINVAWELTPATPLYREIWC